MVASNKSNDQPNYSKRKCCSNKWATINHYHYQGTLFWQQSLYFLILWMIMNVSSICVTKSSLMHSDLNISSPPIPTEEEHLLKFSTVRFSHQPFGKFILRLSPQDIGAPLMMTKRRKCFAPNDRKVLYLILIGKIDGIPAFLTSPVELSPPEQLQVVDSTLSNPFII